MKIQFSVLIPVYHKERPEFFDDCLSSMFKQTTQPDEIVIVKDGALTPELETVIQSWKKEFKERLKIVPIEKNLGMSLALNKAIDHCSFDWIARMDSDDIAKEDRFEKQLSFIENNPAVDVFSSWIEEYDDEMKVQLAERKVPALHADIKKYAKYRNPINHMTAMYRKRCALEVGGYPTGFSTADDYAFWVHMIQKGYIFGNITESLVKARTGKGFLERRKGLEYLKYEIKFIKHLKKINFYNNKEYVVNLIGRSTARLLPNPILSEFYKIIRKN